MKKDKIKNAHFVAFHKTMKKYVNNAGMADIKGSDSDIKKAKRRFSQSELYNELFSIQLQGTSQEEGGISDAQICRWLNGKEGVPNGILSYVFNDQEGCRCHYCKVFEKYVDEKDIFRTAEAETKLAEEMYSLKADWGIGLFSMAQGNNLWDILAETLVTSLICDHALNSVKLEISLQRYLLEQVDFCRRKNIEFKMPYVLSVLFQNDHSLLVNTLNKLEKGLGRKWSSSIAKYINHEHSQTYEEVCLEENGLLNYARILSFLNGKDEADELELCSALVSYPGPSNTLKQLKATLCKYGYNDYGRWRKLLLQIHDSFQNTTTDYFGI